MKRLHIHVAVPDIPASIPFYSKMFGCEPTVLKDDYAKWQLEDPKVNFAISSRGAPTGINHLGIQVDNETELGEMKTRLDAIEGEVLEQTGTACCYAKSDKYWVNDPAGIPWETFYTLDSIPMFNDGQSVGCCIPEQVSSKESQNSCCVPASPSSCAPSKKSCC